MAYAPGGGNPSADSAVGTGLEIERTFKRFGGVHALRGASLRIPAGEIHGLVGANGSGKSTLLNILSGQILPDAGRIVLDGTEMVLGDPRYALRVGVATVTQETTLVPELSVAENVLLGHRHTRRWFGIDWGRSRRRAARVLERLAPDIDLEAKAGMLRPDQQQMVEIARALSRDARLLILDEPTSSLTEAEVAKLFDAVRALKAQGVTTIFVSHRLKELYEIVERITILRDGVTVASGPIDEYRAESLIEFMVGHPPDAHIVAEQAAGSDSATSALSVRSLSVRGAVSDASFEVAPGEIVGLAGLVGAGRSALLDALFGARLIDSGAIEVRGEPVALRGPADAIARGIAYVPGDRKNLGLVLGMSVRENLMLAVGSRGMRLRRLSRAREVGLSNEAIGAFGIVAASCEAPCGTLSGGNQQKVVIAKWLGTSPRVLLLDEPTRGVDFAAKAEIYRILDESRRDGLGIVVSSSENAELLELCDKILVMFRGEIVLSLPRERASEALITQYAMGHG